MSELPQITSSSLVDNTTHLGNITKTDDDDNLMRVVQKIYERKRKTMADTAGRRLVKVVIVDPEEDVPLDKCLLHNSDEMFTDLTDEELFFEISIKELLTKHNKERVKIKKSDSEKKSETLKPARIRDLKMIVVTIAQF